MNDDDVVLENGALRLRFEAATGRLIGLEAVETGWTILDRPRLGLSFWLLVPLPDRRAQPVQVDRLGAGGSYTQFYAMDLEEGFMLMGHDGPGHIAISDRRPILRGLGLYHGKAGHGISVEFSVKTGPVTILGVTQTADGRLKLLVAEGESVPGEILRIGNTNSRLRFTLPPDEFMDRWCQEGPTHHVALGCGHEAATLRKVGRLLGLETVVVS